MCVRVLLYVWVPMPLYMCPHTAVYVSPYCYICVRMIYVSSYCYVFLHPAIHASSYCVGILLCMCPYTAISASAYCYIFVLILLYMCPHTAISASSYCYICRRCRHRAAAHAAHTMLQPKETRCTPREGQVLTPRPQVRQQDIQNGRNLPHTT